jgi:Holliday junction DNA helicase RuvA
MIASIAGTVAAVGPEAAVVEVGGVGIAVVCTPATLATLRLGEPARLSTSLVVREDALTLYGFATDDERVVFETLQSVSGVGPRLAQAVLAVHSPGAVRAAVATEDAAAFVLVPGIGRKGAARILLELKDRLAAPLANEDRVVRLPGQAAPEWREQLRSALLGLGWSNREVSDALTAVAPDAGPNPDVAALLRQSLQLLSKA